MSDEDQARLAHQYRTSIEAPEELITLRVSRGEVVARRTQSKLENRSGAPASFAFIKRGYLRPAANSSMRALVLVVFYLSDSFLYLLSFVRQRNRHDSIVEMFSDELQFQLSLNSNGCRETALTPEMRMQSVLAQKAFQCEPSDSTIKEESSQE